MAHLNLLNGIVIMHAVYLFLIMAFIYPSFVTQGVGEREQKRPDGEIRLIVFLDKQVTLSCPSNGSNFSWTHWDTLDKPKLIAKNGRLTEEYKERFTVNGSQLVIRSAQYANDGQYQCEAANIMERQTILLTVVQLKDCRTLCKSISKEDSVSMCMKKCGRYHSMNRLPDFVMLNTPKQHESAVIDDTKKGDDLQTGCEPCSCVWKVIVAVIVAAIVPWAICGLCLGFVARSKLKRFVNKIRFRLCGSVNEDREHLLAEQHPVPINERPSLRGIALIATNGKLCIYNIFKDHDCVYIHEQADKSIPEKPIPEPWKSESKIELKDARDLYDIVACPQQQCVYVAGGKDMCIWRIGVVNRVVKVWKSFDNKQPRFLSVVTGESADNQQTVYVTFSENLFGIYRADGSEIRLLKIPTEFGAIKHFTLQHMIPCESGDKNEYVATRYADTPIQDHQICRLIITEDGADVQITRCFGREHGSKEGQMNGPFYVVACGEHGYAVADDENYRVILFRKDLTVYEILQSQPPGSRPRRLTYFNGCLFIGNYKSGVWTRKFM